MPRFRPVLGENVDKRLSATVTPQKAYHNDYSGYSDSFGFVIKIEDPAARMEYALGYTGDTSWYGDIAGQYDECNAVLIHLGSLIDRKKKFSAYTNGGEECLKLIEKKNHPYLMGLLHLLTEMQKGTSDEERLIFVSEFGEELRGKIRLDLIERLGVAYGERLCFLPVDVGLDVLLCKEIAKDDNNRNGKESKRDGSPRVKCVICERYVTTREADFEHYGHDEALFCVCKTCRKSTPLDVLQGRLRSLYEVGWPLETH